MRHATDPDPDPAGTTSMRPSADSHVKRQNKQETNIHKYNTIVVKTQNKKKNKKNTTNKQIIKTAKTPTKTFYKKLYCKQTKNPQNKKMLKLC